jgi:ATP-dependent RNA helicase SUPV3L1/SUV3
MKTAWARADMSVQAHALELGIDRIKFKVLASTFGKVAVKGLEMAQDARITNVARLGWNGEALRVAYVSEGAAALRKAALGAFIRWCARQPIVPNEAPQKTTLADPAILKLRQLAAAADRRYASETHPSARQLRRKIILHVGPTNSGKTHRALVALAQARTGVYAGPLRLLAHEVFSRFNEGKIGDEGKRVCNLITGEEQRIIDIEAGLSSCTIEMYPMAKRLDVGVIDEIQMIGDPGRGAAWTQAILGSNCTELHLCGEESVVELIQTIAKELGDECVVNRYSRLSPLVVAQNSLGSDLSKIRPGDCLVTFSRSNIFAFKRAIEEKTGLRVAVAYGGLPPEVREEQARTFNEGGYDVLVASDAVGMGLNL